MYHPTEVAKLTKLIRQYHRGLLTAQDFIFQSIDILEDEIRREASMVMPTVITFEEAQEQLSIKRNSDWLGLPPS